MQYAFVGWHERAQQPGSQLSAPMELFLRHGTRLMDFGRSALWQAVLSKLRSTDGCRPVRGQYNLRPAIHLDGAVGLTNRATLECRWSIAGA
jgi:hypothetical protein